MTRFRPLVLAAGASLAVGLVGCGNGPPGNNGSGGATCTSGTAGVSLGTPAVKVAATDALVFDPSATTAKVSDVIEWDNTGTQLHNITFDGCASVNDDQFAPGGKWQAKFTVAGAYTYHCTIHPGMDGKLTVG
jgi:plastocyanin